METELLQHAQVFVVVGPASPISVVGKLIAQRSKILSRSIWREEVSKAGWVNELIARVIQIVQVQVFEVIFQGTWRVDHISKRIAPVGIAPEAGPHCAHRLTGVI